MSTMKMDLIALCDAAVETNGRFNILGTIDYFWAGSLPYTYPKCALALRIRFESVEEGKYPIRILIVDADGKPILAKSDLEIEVKSMEEDIPTIRHAVLDIHSLRFEKYGLYAVQVGIGRNYMVSLPFSVVPPKVGQAKPRFSF